jgi:hypothetical protein
MHSIGNHSHCLSYWMEMLISFPTIQVYKVHIITSYLIQVYECLQSQSDKKYFQPTSNTFPYLPHSSPKQFIPHSDIHLPYTIMPSTKPQACSVQKHHSTCTTIQSNQHTQAHKIKAGHDCIRLNLHLQLNKVSSIHRDGPLTTQVCINSDSMYSTHCT